MIHAAFDGELSASEQQELDALLDANEEARAYRASLEKLDGLLKEVGAPEVPARLGTDIRAAIDVASVNPTNGRQAGARSWSVPVLAMAASVVLAVGLIFIANPLNINEMDNVSGTMAGPQLVPVQERQLVRVPGLAADMNIEWRDATLVLYIGLESKTSTTTTLEFPDKRFALQHLADNLPEALIMPGEARIENAGDAEIIAEFRQLDAGSGKESSITVTFSQDGKVVSTAELHVPPPG